MAEENEDTSIPDGQIATIIKELDRVLKAKERCIITQDFEYAFFHRGYENGIYFVLDILAGGTGDGKKIGKEVKQ